MTDQIDLQRRAADLDDIARSLFSELCEGEGQHSEELDRALILKHLKRAALSARETPLCQTVHPSTGAKCELPPGHEQNHRGQFDNGIAQWPRETPPEPSALERWLSRLGNLIANLAHPKGDHRENALEDEAHDIVRELRSAIATLTQAKAAAEQRIRELETANHEIAEETDRQIEAKAAAEAKLDRLTKERDLWKGRALDAPLIEKTLREAADARCVELERRLAILEDTYRADYRADKS